MKRIIHLIITLLPIFGFAQSSIIIGSDSLETRYGPIYIFSNISTTTNSWYLSLYDHSEIVAAGGYASDITGISWFKTDTGGYVGGDATFEVYIKATPYIEFASPIAFDDEVGGATLVYKDSTESLSNTIGWIDYTLNAPFHWNGSDNLMILTRWSRIGFGTGAVKWQSTNTGVNKVSLTWNACCSPGTYNLMTLRPNVKFQLSQQPSNDAGVISLDSIRGRCPGNVGVYATIKNFGINPMDSVHVNWDIDGALQIPITFTGNLQALSSAQVLLGNTIFTSGVSHTIKAWTTNPNGTVDTSRFNDSISVFNLMPGYNGTYTIGSTGADFSSFASAVSALENNGVCGPTELLFNAGNYAEKIIMHEIPNASLVNNIVFRSATNDSSSVIIEWPASSGLDSNYTLRLEGTKYVTFKSLTLSRPDTNVYSNIVEMTLGSSHIKFLNNKFNSELRNIIDYPLGSQSGILNMGSSKWNDLVVRNNYFFGNANGIWANGKPGDYSDSLIIENNVFETYYSGASLQYQNSPKINGNIIIRNDTSSEEDYYGIYLLYTLGAMEIQKNKITGYTGSYGISIIYYDSTDTRGLIANNFIQAGPNTGTGTGINIEASDWGLDIFNNSIHYTGIVDGRALEIAGLTQGNLRVMNNILSNSGGGYSIYIESFSLNTVTVSDNNCFFSNGNFLAHLGGDRVTLADIQNATHRDSNSVNADPNFASFNDLHTMANPLSNAGSSLPGLTEDIDGDARSLTHPDIGADEFTDVGITSISREKLFRVYPNPVDEILTIDGTGTEYSIDEIILIDITGRDVFKQTSQGKKININVSKLSGGFYLLRLTYSGKIQMESIIIE